MNDSSDDNSMLPAPQGKATPSTAMGADGGAQTSPVVGSGQQQIHGPGVGVAQVTDLPATAGDIDLIEKEWVSKAKAIVASTIGDPKRQSYELGNAKSQYIAKRFNKELPRNE